MATYNHQSATVHPAPPHLLPIAIQPRPTAKPPSPLFDYLEIFAFIVLMIIIMFVPFIFIPSYPCFELISVSTTPLSTTVPATWNLTLKVSNPNPIWKIFYKELHVGVFYIGNETYDVDFQSKLIGGTVVGPFFQNKGSANVFYPNLSVSTESAGSMVVNEIMENKKRGSLYFQIRVSFLNKYNMWGMSEWRMNRIFCRDLKMVFNDSDLRFSPNVPRKCQLFWDDNSQLD